MNDGTSVHTNSSCAIEHRFPYIPISEIAEQESWRKEVNRPIYHIHKWWATRLGSIFRGIVLGSLLPESQDIMSHYYQKNDFNSKIILDPFMGSGTTIGEAVKLGAKAIGCDINPISTFIVNQSFENVSEVELQRCFSEIELNIKDTIQSYYVTRDPETGEKIPVLYFFWVKMLECPNGETVPLFSHYIFSKNAYPKKKPVAQIVCPECWSVFQGRYDAKEVVCPNCGKTFNPQKGNVNGQTVVCRDGETYKIKEIVKLHKKPLSHKMYAILALRANGDKIYLKPSDFDKRLYQQASKSLQLLDTILPTLEIRHGHNTDQAIGYNYHYWSEFFNDRQLLCLNLLLQAILKIPEQNIQEQFLCLFSGVLEFNNLFCSFKGEGTGAVRHLFYNHILKPERAPIENSIWGTEKSSGTFSTLFKSRLLKAKAYLKSPFEIRLAHGLFNNTVDVEKIIASDPISACKAVSWDDFIRKEKAVYILNGDSAKINIPDCSVDAVVTDPPYFDFVHYSELSDFFFAWLSPVLKERYGYFNNSNCTHGKEVQHKDPYMFSKSLCNVFSECKRVLKNEGSLVFSFHHSRIEGWAAIYQAIIKSGFVLVNFYPVYAEFKGAAPKHSANSPISIDILLVCKKNTYTDRIRKNTLRNDISQYTNTFLASGLKLSENDIFVIKSASLLFQLGNASLSYDETCDFLRNETSITKQSPRLTVMNSCLDRLEEIFAEKQLPNEGKDRIPAQNDAVSEASVASVAEIAFEDVTFGYGEKEVIRHVSFSLEKNKMLALVGPSGGGKTTIANLLARFWDVRQGKALIRGKDVRDAPLSDVMAHISMVFQRVYLFQDTIYNNISMGRPDATEAEVIEAAKKAAALDFIMALPDGFKTVIGEGGASLSGGEKQRVSIARCILKDAPIIILDEATASVDADNETYIQEAISELCRGKTLLVIAHRLNTIRHADKILVISAGIKPGVEQEKG